MVEKTLSLHKIGFSQKHFFYLFVLKELKLGNQYIAEMYQKLQDTFPTKQYTRSQFYRVVKEMDESLNWIEPIPTKGNKTLYRLTEDGSFKLDNYYATFYSNYSFLLVTCERFLHKNNHNHTFNLSNEQQRYFSNLINVKELLCYFILKHLARNRRRYYGSEIRQELKRLYGWQSSEGYLYDVIHEMEERLLIEGQWGDMERRKRKYFHITDQGIKSLPNIEQNTSQRLLQIRQFLLDMIKLFNCRI
ncbi:PadR family transcriptional regulator [Brevibacillus laterosporus]|uniref:PadR family transcriptional regulator n=1 Tax=Brevibacillus laterosporus TaxID=1465 RepID=UPI00112D6326|nr:PadR family transcriptional regulator [Brevibacillus laterosporus]MED4766165.1 PadR family transcriptional regulator [Brevibacillus laterosporus]TPH15951.1 PadR family transcriptional regulator [Brevibacillus laterosporus]